VILLLFIVLINIHSEILRSWKNKRYWNFILETKRGQIPTELNTYFIGKSSVKNPYIGLASSAEGNLRIGPVEPELEFL